MNVLFPTNPSQKVSPVWQTTHSLADEGSFFVASNTVGTTIAMTTSVVDDAATASSTHAQYSPVLYMYNKGSASDQNAKSMYPLYLRLIMPYGSQAWTSATNAQFSVRVDPTSRYSSGGTALTVANANTNSSLSSAAQIYFGANVVGLPTAAARVLSHGQIQGTIPLPCDQWIFTFGDVVAPTNVLGASAIKNLTIPCGPIVLAPGWSMQLDIWAGSLAAAPAFEVEFGYAERVSGL